jgi:hypothetical protein
MHHSSICEQIAKKPLLETEHYDCLINNKRVEFKETCISQKANTKIKNDKYLYHSYCVSNKDRIFSDFLVFVNLATGVISILDNLQFKLITNETNSYTRISDKKVIKYSLYSSDNITEISNMLYFLCGERTNEIISNLKTDETNPKTRI